MRLTMSVYARKNLGQLFSLTSLNLVNKKWTISIWYWPSIQDRYGKSPLPFGYPGSITGTRIRTDQ